MPDRDAREKPHRPGRPVPLPLVLALAGTVLISLLYVDAREPGDAEVPDPRAPQAASAERSDLTAVITDLTGQPLPGMTFWIRGVDGASSDAAPVQTDHAGRLQLEELRAGKVELESRSLPLLQATELVLEPGRHHHVEIPLDWGDSWMLGQITNEKGEPVAGARVTVRWKRRFADVISQSYREATSDLEGFFAVSNLGARDYTLTVHAPGYSKKRLRHRIEQASPQLQALWPPPVAARLTESEG